MASHPIKYSKLAPLTLEMRINLAISACNFFSPVNYRKNCAIIKKIPDPSSIRPLSGQDFIKYIEITNLINEPDKYTFRIRQLLERLVSSSLLTDMGQSSNVLMPKLYYFQKEFSSIEKTGTLWLSSALGNDFIYKSVSPGIVQITGKTKDGDVHAGTGLIIGEHYILTCSHVVTDMTLDIKQEFQGGMCTIVQQLPHQKIDVALIQVAESLRPVPDLSFVEPEIAKPILVLGFPRIPFAREAALILHQGEVTNENVTTLDGCKVFLYSAVARPGNSGGPVITTDGHIIGISFRELVNQDGIDVPYFAGVPTGEIICAIDDFNIGIQIKIEDYQ